MRRIALARKNLFQDRRRTALAIAGVSAAFVLVLVLDGVFAGAMRQVTTYIRTSPADVFIAQRDVTTMHMTASALAPSLIDEVRTIDGVGWAEGLRYTTSSIDVGENSLITYVLGYDTASGRGGPRHLASGHPPTSGQALVDSVAAGELGVGIGDKVTILGKPFVISGLSKDGTYIANTTVFINRDDFAMLRGPTFAYILVGTRDGVSSADLRQRLSAALPDTTVMTRAEFARHEANVVRTMAADIMAVMSAIGFLIALALIGLTLFTAVIAKQREFGIIKALGASRTRLLTVVLAQAAWTVTLAFALATVVSLAIGAAIDALTPNLAVDIEVGSLVRTGIGALVVASTASVLPLRRVFRVDPSTSFRTP